MADTVIRNLRFNNYVVRLTTV